mmetsp:Transcript_114031/g.322838  ORF Transcript_114031/g.322838 Transcript_114031/m.322838 type:complete len:280 (-) Transcript_114031:553-1392(-)
MDHGSSPPEASAATIRSSSWSILTSSTPCCRASDTSRKVYGFSFSVWSRGSGQCSASHLIALKGSRTCASGIRAPMICTSRGTSRRGKTSPGESQRQVLSSRTTVCSIFVWPGVAFTETVFSPYSALMMEDLPTFGWPTHPSTTCVGTAAPSPDWRSPAAACWTARWHASRSACLPKPTGAKPSGLRLSCEKPTTSETPGRPLLKASAQRRTCSGDTVSSLFSTSTRGFRRVHLICAYSAGAKCSSGCLASSTTTATSQRSRTRHSCRQTCRFCSKAGA